MDECVQEREREREREKFSKQLTWREDRLNELGLALLLLDQALLSLLRQRGYDLPVAEGSAICLVHHKAHHNHSHSDGYSQQQWVQVNCFPVYYAGIRVFLVSHEAVFPLTIWHGGLNRFCRKVFAIFPKRNGKNHIIDDQESKDHLKGLVEGQDEYEQG